MHQLREMPEDMSDGGRGKQKRPQSQECHGVHPLSEVYESLSDQGFVNLRFLSSESDDVIAKRLVFCHAVE